MQNVNSFNVLEYLRRLARENERQTFDTIGKRIEAQAAKRQKIDAIKKEAYKTIYMPQRDGLL